MKLLDIELRTECLLRLSAQSPDLEAPDLVRIALTRPANPTINVDRRLFGRAGGMGKLIVDCLLTRPTLGVHPRFHHHRRALVNLVLQPAKSRQI